MTNIPYGAKGLERARAKGWITGPPESSEAAERSSAQPMEPAAPAGVPTEGSDITDLALGVIRLAQLERALVRRGVADDDLRDARVLLDASCDSVAGTEAIDAAAEGLRGRRPELFGRTAEPPARVVPLRPRGQLPKGNPARRTAQQQQVFGAGGIERARKKGWVE